MPTPPLPWTLVDSTPLADCVVFQVSRDRARSPQTGREHDFYRLAATDWVNVVPVTPAGDIVLVRQYRHGARRATLEIPGGMVDAGETPGQAATRECLEETGYGGGRLVALGSVNPNPALFGNRCHTFLLEGVVPVGEIRNDGTEETSVELASPAQLDAHIASGEIDHALVIAALYWLERRHAGCAPCGLQRRPATASDRDFVFQVKAVTVRYAIEAAWGWDAYVQRKVREDRFEVSGLEILLDGEEQAGYLKILREADGIRLLSIFLLPPWQSRGIGTAILEGLQREATAATVPVRLRVLRANVRARALYERLGFVATGTTETHHEMRWQPRGDPEAAVRPKR